MKNICFSIFLFITTDNQIDFFNSYNIGLNSQSGIHFISSFFQKKEAIDYLSLKKHKMPNGFSWVVKCSPKTKSKIGLTYGQKVGLNGVETTISIVLKPGEVKDLGRGENGSAPYRKVRIISAWWE